jgi:hypothetical protein
MASLSFCCWVSAFVWNGHDDFPCRGISALAPLFFHAPFSLDFVTAATVICFERELPASRLLVSGSVSVLSFPEEFQYSLLAAGDRTLYR